MGPFYCDIDILRCSRRVNEETKILQYKLNKDYLTIDDVIRYGGIGKIYLVIGKDPTVKYWLCKNKDGNVLVPADKEPYYSEISHRLLIIGNGFDLHCGANSTYNAFFDEQFGISLAYEVEKLCLKDVKERIRKEIRNKFVDQVKEIFNDYYFELGYRNIEDIFTSIELNFLTRYKNKLLSELIFLSQRQKINAGLILNQIDKKIEWLQGAYSKWDIVFFLAESFYSKQNNVNWSDIEKMIFYIINLLIPGSLSVTINLWLTGNLKIKTRIKNRKFNKLIKSLFRNKENISHDLLIELEIFEKEFAVFIQRKETYQYYEKAKKTMDGLVLDKYKAAAKYTVHTKNQHVILDVFDFNYSLNSYDANHRLNLDSKITLHSWTNIHGIADYNRAPDDPAPIFGIDLYEMLNRSWLYKILGISINLYKDSRLKFTKSYRLSTNHVNNIRTKQLQKKVDIITIVGHSLSSADYSYFESLFDKYELYDGNVVLECYYADGIDSEEDYTKQVDALLTDYGKTLKVAHGINIFNKLMLEQRLKIMPYPKK